MKSQSALDYERIAAAIAYLRTHFREQPDLATVAAQVHLSPFHFQRLFTEWAGVSPKRFVRFLSLTYARERLRASSPTVPLGEIAFATGLSGTGRLHELFVTTEAMTPAEYRDGGAELDITYAVGDARFGPTLLASTARGICHLSFPSNVDAAVQELHRRFSNARFAQGNHRAHEAVWRVLRGQYDDIGEIKLHLRGTPFQLKVWEALLQIPTGRLTTYGALAERIGQPGAARAVGSAVGKNEVALLIPCHRVIRGSGELGGYRWGEDRKAGMLGWEAAKLYDYE